MEIVTDVLVVVHLLGWAAAFGGLVVQVREPAKRVNGAVRDGIGTAFVVGLVLVGLLEAGADPVNHAKVGVKFAIGLVLLVLVMANLRKERLPDGLFWGLLGLLVANVGVAVLW